MVKMVWELIKQIVQALCQKKKLKICSHPQAGSSLDGFVMHLTVLNTNLMIVINKNASVKIPEGIFISFCFGLKVQMKCFFIAEFERAAKIRKIAVYRFLTSFLVPEL